MVPVTRADEPVEVVPASAEWAAQARVLRAEVLQVLDSGYDVDVEHIGSTSVPCLAAKPIIDLMVGCPDPLRSVIAGRIADQAGYEHLRDLSPTDREYLRRRGSPPWSNVHVVVLDGALWRDNLAFRDFLRTHPDAAAEYAAAKRTAAGRESGLRAYSGAKARTVQKLLDRARQWASDTSGSTGGLRLGYVPRMDIDVAPIREATDEAVESFGRLLPQLSSSAAPLTRDGLLEILGCPTNTVLVARAGGRMVGALTLVLVPIPTGVRAWIEDVVVDTDTRGLGVGSALTREAVRIAEAAGARTVDLTSRPSRIAANRMYERVGFARRDTHVYRYSAEAAPSSAGKGDPSSSASSR